MSHSTVKQPFCPREIHQLKRTTAVPSPCKAWNLLILLSLGSRSRQLWEAKVIVPAGLAISNVMVGAFVVATLYFAREILVPIALAVLLSFVLAPLVRILQRLKIPRTLAVMGAVGMAFVITFSLATMVMVEVDQLANDLPRYETTFSEKIRNLRNAAGRAGLLTNGSNLLKDLDRELNAKDQNEAPATKSSLPDGAKGKTPIPVEVHQPDPAPSETLVAMLRPLVTPFTTTGIVVIFLIFFLF
jgi:predicted PurR-regulated permease PerM